jgi:hypothetical protein
VREVVGEGTEDFDVELTEPGVYRAEIRMTPRHLEPYLNGYEGVVVGEMPWVYSGAIRVF